jgi:thymidylate synthase ThyX
LSQITAKIIADSYSAINGKRITTFELQYPRFIHSELMTHRLFSRNAMSSRAVPIEKMIEQVWSDPALPIHWGKNQSGMQAKEQLEHTDSVEIEWRAAACEAAISAKFLSEQGLHKQVVNRILEPWQLMKTVLTATEFDNFFWLRKHEDAQPEIKELAERVYEQLEWNKLLTVELDAGDWHTPYYEAGYWLKEDETPLEDALAISSSCCAQVSYRLLDDSIEKARKVYQRLVESTPVHASPFEHQATPMDYSDKWDCTDDGVNVPKLTHSWEEGVTHCDKQGNLWSGNFKSWVQYRQLIDGNVCNKYEEK